MGDRSSEDGTEDRDVEKASQEPAELEYWARFASIYCIVVPEVEDDGGQRRPDPAEVLQSVAKALEADSRVRAVAPTEPSYLSYEGVFPWLQLDPLDAPPADLMQRAMESATPIAFSVSVPGKNQPTWGLDDEVAAEDYMCAWDGGLLLVMWESATSPPPSGGHIVRDIVAEAIDRAGYISRVQGPSMAHVDVHILFDDTERLPSGSQVDWRQVDVTLPVERGGLPEAMIEFFSRTSLLGRAYYRVENTREAYMQVKSHLHVGIERLLRLHHRRAKARVLPFKNRIRERWRLRKTRTRLRELESRVLLETAMLQGLRVEHLERLSEYQATTTDWGLGVVFHPWVESTRIEVTRDDLTAGPAAAEYVAHRLDKRDVVVATLWGVVFGALLGVAATLIASL